MKLRSLLAVALLVPAVAFAAPPSKSKKAAQPTEESSSASPMQGLSVGGFLGYETADFSGFTIRLDGELPFRDLTPQIKMSWVGSLGYSRLTWDQFGGAWKATTSLYKIVPAARFTMPVNDQIEVFGDAGLGLVHISMSVDVNIPGFGTVTGTGSSNNLMMRLGAGGWYKVNPQLKVGAMLEFDPIFGDYGSSGTGVGSQNTFLILVGGMYRI